MENLINYSNDLKFEPLPDNGNKIIMSIYEYNYLQRENKKVQKLESELELVKSLNPNVKYTILKSSDDKTAEILDENLKLKIENCKLKRELDSYQPVTSWGNVQKYIKESKERREKYL